MGHLVQQSGPSGKRHVFSESNKNVRARISVVRVLLILRLEFAANCARPGV